MRQRYWKYLIIISVAIALCIVAVVAGTSSTTKVVKAPTQTTIIERPEPTTTSPPGTVRSLSSITKVETEECHRTRVPSERCLTLGSQWKSEEFDNGAKEGSYTDEEGYTYTDNERETYCSDSPKSALPSCENTEAEEWSKAISES